MKGPIGNTTRQVTRDEKKTNGERVKKEIFVGFIMLVMESATAGCGIPNDSLAGISHAIKIQSIGSMFVIVASPETLWQTKRRLSTWLFFILASKFIRIRAFLKGISR